MMIRKTLIAATAAATMALGLGLATAPAQAVGNFNLGATVLPEAEGSLLQEARHYVTKCRWKRVYRYGYWQRIKVCRKVYPPHYGY
jgi:hypothetical protein